MSINNTSSQHGLISEGTPSSSDSTVVASPSSWKENLKPSDGLTPPTSRQHSYLDVPSFRPSFDSTHSELSELSFHSDELQGRYPLIPSIPYDAALASKRLPPPSCYRTAWDSFYYTNYGALLVLASQGFGVGMNICTRLLETPGSHGAPMHPFQILFARQSLTALICTAYGMYTKRIPYFPVGPRGVRWLLMLRGIAGFFGVFGMYFSLLYLPLSEATVLSFLTPMLTCYLVSYILPGEIFSVQQQIASFVSLIGVLFIARPASLFATSEPPQPADAAMKPPSNSTMPANDLQNVTPEQHLAAVGVAMIGVVGATGAFTTLRVIGTRAHAFISINYFSVWCSVLSLACLIVFPDVKFRLPGNLTEWTLFASLVLCGFVMLSLLTAGLAYGGPSSEPDKAYSLPGGGKIQDLECTTATALEGAKRSKSRTQPSATRATAMCYTQMLFALAGDKLVFGVTPDTMSWVGSVLILAGAVWLTAARDSVANDRQPRQGKSRAMGGGNGLETLRRQGSVRDGAATHEEAAGLMNGHVEDDVRGAHKPVDDREDRIDKGSESLELHELQSSNRAR